MVFTEIKHLLFCEYELFGADTLTGSFVSETYQFLLKQSRLFPNKI